MPGSEYICKHVSVQNKIIRFIAESPYIIYFPLSPTLRRLTFTNEYFYWHSFYHSRYSTSFHGIILGEQCYLLLSHLKMLHAVISYFIKVILFANLLYQTYVFKTLSCLIEFLSIPQIVMKSMRFGSRFGYKIIIVMYYIWNCLYSVLTNGSGAFKVCLAFLSYFGLRYITSFSWLFPHAGLSFADTSLSTNIDFAW